MLNRAIELIQLAKENKIEILLNEDQLKLKLPKNKNIDKGLLDDIKGNKELIIDFLKKKAKGSNGHDHNIVIRVNRDPASKIPLSFSQERLWFIDQLEGSIQYHLPSILRLKGKLDTAVLSYALQQIINRQQILRTVILQEDGRGYQEVINSNNEWKLNIVDGTRFKEDKEGLQQYFRQLVNVPFDLSKDYMLRADLICLDSIDHVLVVTIHHIASDGTSTSVIVKELIEFWRAYEEGREPLLATLPLQYSDFAFWQRGFLQEALEAKIAYWKSKLRNVEPLLLPVDYQRPLIQTARGAITRFVIGKDLTTGIHQLGMREGATIFMTLLTAFKVLLYRYTGQDDICVGTPIAGRQQKELELLVGFFINTLALRTQVNGSDSFIDLLKKVKDTTLDAYDHQETPFEKVVDALVKERDLSRSPVFQVMFVFQNTPEVQALTLGGVELSGESLTHDSAKFEITFTMTERDGIINGAVEYNTDLYNAGTIQGMISHFTTLIASILKGPDQEIGVLPMISQAEELQLVSGFNNNSTVYPSDKSIVGLFEEQALKTPAAIAVVFEEEEISYEELNARANQLAHYLQEKGVKKEALVPICLERSIDMMVGILGILKAGAAYVPIDPVYPAERISFMLEDIAATLLVTSKECIKKLPSFNNITVVETGSESLLISQYPVTDLQLDIQPADLAYVIYTSGSTGRPKGVMVTQNNVVSLVKGVDYISLSGKDVLLSTGSVSFDATTFEYWGMLLNGGRLVLCSESRLLDHEQLKQEINSQGVNCMWFTSSWFNQLAEVDISLFENLETVLAGGEKLSETYIEKLRNTYPAITIINGYGPTENTTFSLTYHIKEAGIKKSIPIGHPLNNRCAFILDKNGQLVPVGVTGELHVGGAGVARGYLNLPELTAERFIENIFSKEPGSKLYRTGDLGRWLPDGAIEYLGRLDDQVKIRGYRIELGEIESVLQNSGLVSQAVVLARESRAGTKQLVGYVLAAEGFTKEAVRAYLSSHLPEYMIPHLWVELGELPLTSNGKVDRKSLPEVDTDELAGKDYVAPRNELEKQLSETWQKLLGREQVGVHDNFFELGGDSILTIQVVSRMRRLGYELQPRDIFLHQTIGGLSAAVAGRVSAVSTAEQGQLSGPAGLLPIQQWYLGEDPAEVSHFNQAVLLSAGKTLTGAMLREAVEQLAAQHDALRFRYRKLAAGWEQAYGDSKGILITEDLLSAAEGTLGARIRERSEWHQRELDIEQGQIFRAVLMETPATESHNRLLLVIHHLAVDGVSWRILLEDLEAVLSGLSDGSPAVLGAKSSSYRHWYQWLKQYGSSRAVLSQQGYWEHTIRNYTPLPVDKDATAGVMERCSIRLNGEQTRRLLQEVPRVYHTEINDILLAALAGVLCQWAGESSVVIGLEGHGREQEAEGIDTSRTVGWFTTLYPLLLETAAGGAGDQIRSVKEQLRRVPGRGLGYGVLKYIGRQEKLQGSGGWDIVFNYLGQLDNVVRESRWLKGAGESVGASSGASHVPREKLSVNSFVQSGELVVNWGYSSRHYETATVRGLAAGYISKLEELIAHCLEQEQSGGPVNTPSDYGLGAEVSYSELDAFLDDSFGAKSRREQVEGIYRLTGLQQGMLFHGLYDGRAGAYTEQFGCELVNPDVERLIESWQYVLKNHSILRSGFYYDWFAVPVQCVYRSVSLPAEVLDYSGLDAEGQAAAVREYEAADREKGFDFKAAPLMRIGLLKLGSGRYRMVWTSHHILFDGWSLPVLMEEFLGSYELLSAGGTLPQKEEDKFEDYIRYTERGDKWAEEDYWRKYMEGVEQGTLLPFIGTTSGRTKGAGSYGSVHLQLDRAASAKIQGYAQRHRLTVNTVMQGVWSLLLHCYTGSQDIVYGTIVSGRPDELAGVEQRVGMYINTLPLHSKMEEDQPLAEWLGQLQGQQVSSRQYQYTPLQQIQQWAGIGGDLFDSLLVFENYPVSEVIGSKKWSLDIKNVQVKEQTNYPLSITVTSTDRISIGFSYNTALLDEACVERIRGHFEHVLEQVTTGAESETGKISIITGRERDQLVSGFNNNSTVYPSDKSIVGLFEEQALKTPAAIAVVFEEEEISYEELNARANQLAHYLQEKGVKKEALVPICLERSIDMMVGILGILKAGAAYVPIDPVYPAERISFMLEDIAATLLVTSKECIKKLPSFNNITVVETGSESLLISQYPVTDLQLDIQPADLAYVIYTSGSTGRPKGVMVTQNNVVSLVKGVDYISLSGKDVLLSTGSVSFDATTFEYWGMLLNGGRLVLCSESRLLDHEQLKQEINSQGVNCMWFTSSWFNQLAEVDISLFENLETVLAGGEKLSETYIEKLRNTYPAITIINGYGPTENTTFSLTYHIKEAGIKKSIPIGHPLNNRCAFILDKNGQLVPVGVTGELHVGGAGVARGYLNLPELTAERFIENIFSKEPGSKLYRTGDLGRWLPDGAIEYLGRLDDQVKIRGYRIELGEIESVLQNSGLVSQAVVLARESRAGTKQLVGYVLAAEGFTKEAVRAYLSSYLPEYMIPHLWVELGELPLTSNGKVDRKSLPEVDTDELAGKDYVAPRNELEKQLSETWQKLLGIEQVGITNNFFELGGNSLLSIRLVSAIRKNLALELSINDIFIYPTIMAFAENIIAKVKNPSKQIVNIKYLVCLKAGGNKMPLYIVCGGGGTALKFKSLADNLDDDQPVYALQAPMDSGLKDFPATIEEIAKAFIDEIILLNSNGPYALSGHCVGAIIAFEMAKQLEAMGKKVHFLAMFDAILNRVNKNKQAPDLMNLFNAKYLIKRFYKKALLKFDFETFLLRQHTRHAFKYKVNAVRKLLDKLRKKNKNVGKSPYWDMHIFDESADLYDSARKSYNLVPYQGELILFYALENYFFVDKNREIGFRKIILSEEIKELWKEYAGSVKIYNVKGEHSTIFEAENNIEFARILQQHLLIG